MYNAVRFRRFDFFLATFGIVGAMSNQAYSSELAIKKSKAGICHCPGGRYYDTVRNYIPYHSIESCIASGGRHPKQGQGPCNKSKRAKEDGLKKFRVEKQNFYRTIIKTERCRLVHRVVDGDTIEVEGFRIRLHGIDAPEFQQTCRDSSGRMYRCGRDAASAVKLLAAGGVSCAVEPTYDRYGRKIATCYSVNGTNINKWMVRQGYALAYRKYSSPYLAEERKARAERRGLHRGDHIAPWEWRRGKRLR